MRRKHQAILTLGLVALALLVACAPAAAPAPAGAPKGEPIKIAAILHLNFPPFAEIMQQCRDTSEMALQEINAQGGVLGRPLELVVEAMGVDPQEGVAAMEKVITRDKVVAVLGPEETITALAAHPVAERSKVPTFSAMQADDREIEQGWKYHFAISSRSSTRAKAFIDFVTQALQPKAESVAILTENVGYGSTMAPFLEKEAKAAGLKVAIRDTFDAAAMDFKPLLTRVKGLNPDVVFWIGYINDGILAMRQSKEIGFNAKAFIGQSGWDYAAFIASSGAGDAAEYTFAQLPWFREVKWPGVKEMNDKFFSKYNKNPMYETVQCYGVMKIVADAIKRAGSAEPAKVRDAVAKTDMEMLLGRVKFDERGQNQQYFLFTQVQKGKHVLVWPKDLAAASSTYPTPPWDKR